MIAHTTGSAAPRRGRGGFSLLEMVFAMLVLMVTGIGAIAAVVYTRQSMELEKQRLTALNYARQAMERASTLSFYHVGTVSLVPFNAPGIEIRATVTTEFYPLQSNGAVDWNSPLSSTIVATDDPEFPYRISDIPPGKPYLCSVRVEWTPSGSWSRPQSVSVQGIIRRGLT